MAMTNEQLTKWIDEIFGTIDEIKQNSGDISGLTRSVRQLREDLTATQADVTDLEDQTAGVVSLPKAALQHFTDGSATQALDLVADIIPVQAGTGDPSPTNVRAITGYSSVTATAVGKNLANPSLLLNGFTSPDTGVYAYNALSKTQVVSTKGLDKITVNCTGGNRCSVAYFDEVPTDGDQAATVVSVYGVLPKTIEVDTTHAYIAIQVAYNVTPSQIQVENGEEATPYEAYQANTATISLGSTVYGGSVNFTTGELIVTHRFDTFDGSVDEGWLNNGTNGKYKSISGVVDSFIINEFSRIEKGEATRLQSGQACLNGSGNAFQVALEGYMENTAENLDDWDAWLEAHPMTVCFELATPTTTTLTPAQLQLLQGENNVSAISGPITLTYAPDNVLAEVYAYIQKRFDTLTASLAANRTTRKTTKTLTKKED